MTNDAKLIAAAIIAAPLVAADGANARKDIAAYIKLALRAIAQAEEQVKPQQ